MALGGEQPRHNMSTKNESPEQRRERIRRRHEREASRSVRLVWGLGDFKPDRFDWDHLKSLYGQGVDIVSASVSEADEKACSLCVVFSSGLTHVYSVNQHGDGSQRVGEVVFMRRDLIRDGVRITPQAP